MRDGWPGRDKMSERRIDRNIYKQNAVFRELKNKVDDKRRGRGELKRKKQGEEF